MKHLVVGAGATLGEALAIGTAPQLCPPLIRDFARKTWSNYTPDPILEIYLRELGHRNVGHDPRKLFYDLEEKGVTNIERFMEFAWQNRRLEVAKRGLPPGYISGLQITAGGSSTIGVTADEKSGFWDNLLYHGIGSPLSFLILQCFFENGQVRNLQVSKSVAERLEPTDLVLNLNYDTVFELALTQLGRSFVYSPNHVGGDQLLVCKPHGSLNMVANASHFTFGQPDWLGMPQPPGFRSYSGLIPPRVNKNYSQHPLAQVILEPVHDRQPRAIVMWGVGLAESDADLINLYSRWSGYAEIIDIINPSPEVAERARTLFDCEVRHFKDVADWVQ